MRRRQWQATPVLLPRKSYGWRSLVGCSPWGREESDTIERLPFHFSLSCIGEGNGNPLQYSCLENPRDGRAWWTAVYGVTQSRTRLKWLSSSSSSKHIQFQGFSLPNKTTPQVQNQKQSLKGIVKYMALKLKLHLLHVLSVYRYASFSFVPAISC